MSQPQPDPVSLNVANYLRNHRLLKQRQGLLQGSPVDFFRFKRAERALLSEEYKTKSSNPKNQLPQVNNTDDAKKVFILLIRNRFVMPGKKLHTSEARELNMKPKKGSPCLQPLQQATMVPNEYYLWFYKKTNPWDRLMGIGILIAVFTIVLFPLWPLFMRKGVWYLSMALLGFVCLIVIIAIIRLILFCLTYFITPPGLWLFPNLFEDVGFLDSFKPFYAWNVAKLKEKKGKGSKSRATTSEEAAATTATESKPLAKRRVQLAEEE
jgi:translocation protein SEC62